MAQILIVIHGQVTAAATLNIRRGAPSRSAPISRQLRKGDTFEVIGLTAGENVAGEDDWYVGEGGHEYAWAGGARAGGAGFASGAVRRGANGSISPLPSADLRQKLYPHPFAVTEGANGAVVLDLDWVKENIIEFQAPSSILGGVTMRVHRRAAPWFERALSAIDAAGLGARIITYDGGFVPRHMGWTTSRPLSSHSWGVAMDINARWNGYGVPAPLGQVGSVRELVPILAAEGFAWGGHFERIPDGMHFELARTDL